MKIVKGKMLDMGNGIFLNLETGETEQRYVPESAYPKAGTKPMKREPLTKEDFEWEVRHARRGIIEIW